MGSGRNHTCAALTDATARCWGDNHDGQLGNGLDHYKSTPVSPARIIARFGKKSSATRVAIGRGIESRQQMSCELHPPSAPQQP